MPYLFVWFLLRRGYTGIARAIGLGWLVIFVIVLASRGPEHSQPARSATEATSVSASTASFSEAPVDTPPLSVASWHCGDADAPSFIETTGQVKNVSDKPLKNIEAIAQYFTADGTFVKSDDAIIDYNPVMPGQTSPFKTIGTNNPLIKKCQLSFKSLMGGTVDATIPAAN